MRIITVTALAALLWVGNDHQPGHSAGAPIAQEEEQDVPESPFFNVPLKTTHFAQIWTDHRWRDGFRVQQNALTGHWRLIDGESYRRAWGTKQQCLDALDEKCPPATELTPKHRFILLHGLMRTCGSMKSLETELANHDHPDSIRFSYASTRGSIGEHAAALRELMEHLPPHDTFSFVGHSMGNIVVRHAIGDWQGAEDPQQILPRCQAMVMLGPPNQGAMIAERLAPTKVFGWVTGRGAMELGAQWRELEPHLATPPFPFHIIAGDIVTPVANPLVDGDGDFVVGLEEAKLDGATSFNTVPVLHSFLMDNAEVMEKTIALLEQAQLEQTQPDQ